MPFWIKESIMQNMCFLGTFFIISGFFKKQIKQINEEVTAEQENFAILKQHEWKNIFEKS